MKSNGSKCVFEADAPRQPSYQQVMEMVTNFVDIDDIILNGFNLNETFRLSAGEGG